MNLSLPIWLRVVIAALIVQGGWSWWHDRPQRDPPGVLAPAEPVQLNLDTADAIAHGRWLLTPRAHYDITARVLGRERYRIDVLAALVPVDLALGWGPMSDGRVLDALEIGQAPGSTGSTGPTSRRCRRPRS